MYNLNKTNRKMNFHEKKRRFHCSVLVRWESYIIIFFNLKFIFLLLRWLQWDIIICYFSFSNNYTTFHLLTQLLFLHLFSFLIFSFSFAFKPIVEFLVYSFCALDVDVGIFHTFLAVERLHNFLSVMFSSKLLRSFAFFFSVLFNFI